MSRNTAGVWKICLKCVDFISSLPVVKILFQNNTQSITIRTRTVFLTSIPKEVKNILFKDIRVIMLVPSSMQKSHQFNRINIAAVTPYYSLTRRVWDMHVVSNGSSVKYSVLRQSDACRVFCQYILNLYTSLRLQLLLDISIYAFYYLSVIAKLQSFKSPFLMTSHKMAHTDVRLPDFTPLLSAILFFILTVNRVIRQVVGKTWTYLNTGSTFLKRTEPYLSRLTIYPSCHILCIGLEAFGALSPVIKINHIILTNRIFIINVLSIRIYLQNKLPS